ncbi:Shoot gravitropism-like protein [Thalictrum thalictroides]|uniref:Shoot gravitropism-like protein n=1 Tax=Thalictrum thalictroides TaxID=46969 RepID=A0A7J6X8F5_THATH|nr:Shoot gravitropism-like protein [Thalictrum thalictroides]
MEEKLKELQLLPASTSNRLSAWKFDNSVRENSRPKAVDAFEGPSLNLQLSISIQPLESESDCFLVTPTSLYSDKEIDLSGIKALKWQAEEQIRLATAEKAYAEQVREMTRREMELAQLELARARYMWEKAREEVEKAEKLKDRAIRQIDSMCMEITCQTCWRRFCPSK